MKKHVSIPIFIPHLGCPHTCVFCNQRTISGHKSFDMTEVRAELDRAFATVDVPADQVQIAYFGGSFTGIDRADMLALLRLAKEYRDAGKCGSIRISTRPDYIDEEILELLAAYGVTTIELGIQSMDDGVLAASLRGHTAEDSRRACAAVKAHGFELVGQMMVGLPGSLVGHEIRTAQVICEMGADGARIYPTAVFRDTELAAQTVSGAYFPLTLAEAISRSAQVLAVFIRRNVPVIRIGLQAGEGLAEECVGGGYHPSIGEMVYSRFFRNEIEQALHAYPMRAEAKMTVRVCPSDLSKAIGWHGENRQYLIEQFSFASLHFMPDEALSRNTFELELTEDL